MYSRSHLLDEKLKSRRGTVNFVWHRLRRCGLFPIGQRRLFPPIALVPNVTAPVSANTRLATLVTAVTVSLANARMLPTKVVWCVSDLENPHSIATEHESPGQRC